MYKRFFPDRRYLIFLLIVIAIISGFLLSYYQLLKETENQLRNKWNSYHTEIYKTIDQYCFFSDFIINEMINYDSLFHLHSLINVKNNLPYNENCQLISSVRNFNQYGVSKIYVRFRDGNLIYCDGNDKLQLSFYYDENLSQMKHNGLVLKDSTIDYRYQYPIKRNGVFEGTIEIVLDMKSILEGLMKNLHSQYFFLFKGDSEDQFPEWDVYQSNDIYYYYFNITADDKRAKIFNDEISIDMIIDSALQQKRFWSLKKTSKNYYMIALYPMSFINEDISIYLVGIHGSIDYSLLKKEFVWNSILYSGFILFLFLFILYFHERKRILSSANKLLKVEIEKKKKELTDNYYIDKLTGYYNRYQLIEDLIRYKEPKLAIFDIDSFNEINALFGFIVGDYILIELGRRLEDFCMEMNYSLYKLPGDEYAALASDEESLNDFVSKCEKILLMIENKGIYFEKSEIITQISLGIATGKENILSKADMAIKKAKSEKKHIEIYRDVHQIEGQIKSNLKWASSLNTALAKNQIIPFYQPIYNCKTDRIEKFESLIRLKKENGEIVSPFYFLKIAKKTRVYTKLLRIMLYKSLKYFSQLPFSFSINMSVDDIQNPLTTKFIEKHLLHYDIAERVVFEITESDRIENFTEVSDFIKKFKNFGVKIAVDDFGTGYSNFEYLLKMDIDYIKIDGSLIKNIDKDDNAKLVVENIVEFAKKRNLSTIGEFVHSKDVFVSAKAMGIDFLQGYYIGRPREEVIFSPDFLENQNV